MSQARLPTSMALAYALPMAGLMFFQNFFTQYFFKYSVDVLLVAPATMGTILFVTRMWDAFSDPVVGYLSDRTRAHAGRRRPWLVGAALPVALTTFAMWNPPLALGAAALVTWVFVWVWLWETAMTCFFVPYMAFGSEISMDHHDRTRVAGYRHLALGVGSLLVVACVYLLSRSEEPRALATWLFAGGGALAAALMLAGALRTREVSAHRERGARRPLRAFAEALRNPHLLRLLPIYFFDITGVAAIGLLGPFVAQYVVGDAGLIFQVLLVYQLASYVSTPLMVGLARRLGKVRIWMVAMASELLGFAGSALAGPGDAAWLLGCIALVGLGSTGGHVIGMSILGDVADYDELGSGERKEGVYYAAINIARKLSFSALSVIVGFGLQGIGFDPNQVQTPEVVDGIRWLFAGIPALAFALGMALLLRFQLTEAEHARIREALDRRAEGASG